MGCGDGLHGDGIVMVVFKGEEEDGERERERGREEVRGVYRGERDEKG